MKAITYTRYGSPDVLEVTDLAAPTPGPGEVRIRVRAATVSTADTTFRRGRLLAIRLAQGLLSPKKQVLGTELAGEIEAVGEGVERWRVGDAVVAATGDDFGAHAELVVLPEDGAIGPKPGSVGFEEAAAIVEGALTALPFLRDHGRVGPGTRVLINGASGAVGVAAVQLARHLGAEVTAVASTRNQALLRELGAHHVIDYTTTPLGSLGRTWDVIFDVAGALGFSAARALLEPGGTYLCPVLGLSVVGWSLWTRLFGSHRAVLAFTGLRPAADKAADLALVRDLVDAGELRAVIGARFTMADAAAAHRLVETGHKRGNAVLTVAA
ncbi:MAG: NAD(P)-dependent alcohol dehydrogenase [Alphaproteobacteria bacterium]|nr:NAD(P)-dependent alcohol dehydrogenase [Alphaproteobacteria bacterium]